MVSRSVESDKVKCHRAVTTRQMKAAKRARATEQLQTNFRGFLARARKARISVISTIIGTVNGMVVWYFVLER